jgi:hypothetical protein
MHNQQHGGHLRLNFDRANRVPALLPGSTINAIRTDEASLILKNQRRQFE